MEYYHAVFQKNEKKRPSLLKIIKERRKGGVVYEELVYMMQNVRINPDSKNRGILMRAIFHYCLGYRTMRKFFPQSLDRRIVCRVIPERGQTLYHWTEIENVASIRKNGLVQRCADEYVYLTDDPRFLEHIGFFQWKTEQSGRDMRFVLLKIKAYELSREYDIYRFSLPHEFLVKKVPPQFIEDEESKTENPA